MVQFLSIFFFFWISSIFVGFFKSSRFLCVTLYVPISQFSYSGHPQFLDTAWEKKGFLQIHKKIKLLVMLRCINDRLQPAQVSYTHVHAHTRTFCHRTKFQILPAHEAIIYIYHLLLCPYIHTHINTYIYIHTYSLGGFLVLCDSFPHILVIVTLFYKI